MSERAYSIRTGHDETHKYVGIIPPFEDVDALQPIGAEDTDATLSSVETVNLDNGPEYTRLVFDTANGYDSRSARLLGKASLTRLQELGYDAQIEGVTVDLRNKEPHLFIPKNNLPVEELPSKPTIEGVELPEPPFLFDDNRLAIQLATGKPVINLCS